MACSTVAHHWRLARLARRLNRAGGPALALRFFDPHRDGDAISAWQATPSDIAFVYRHFGAPDRLSVAARLRRVSRRRGARLVIGADLGLAIRVGADGVHLPSSARWNGARAARARRRGLWISAAAHSLRDVRRMRIWADVLVISPIYPTASAVGRPVLGLRKAARLARAGQSPAVALGGVTAKRFERLRRAGFSGFAGVALFNA
jgi:thiamine-phosphate pyrophosphorylase